LRPIAMRKGGLPATKKIPAVRSFVGYLMARRPRRSTADICFDDRHAEPLYNVVMTELLKKAFDKISEELPEFEQDAMGEFLIALIERDDSEWKALLAKAPDKLRQMADQALAEHMTGRTTILDLEKL
jgi:hypothetical protein